MDRYDIQNLKLLKSVVEAHRNVKTVLKSPEMKSLLGWIERKTPLLSDSAYDLTTKVFWILNSI